MVSHGQAAVTKGGKMGVHRGLCGFLKWIFYDMSLMKDSIILADEPCIPFRDHLATLGVSVHTGRANIGRHSMLVARNPNGGEE